MNLIFQHKECHKRGNYIRGVKMKKWLPFDKKLWQRNCCEQEGNIHLTG
jgi:hypothetical protein